MAPDARKARLGPFFVSRNLEGKMTAPTASPVLSPLADAHDLAAETGIPLSRVWQLARSGELPCIRLGRAMRFDREVVAQWLRNGGTRA